jgi:hypothetical protein
MRHFKGISIIKKREGWYGCSAEDMRREYVFSRFSLFFCVIPMDCEQWFARLDLIPHFMVDNETDCVIHVVRLFGAACTERH